MTLPTIPATSTAADATELLQHAGWQLLATGDWSWAFVAPDERTVARVTPWDDAYRLQANACVKYAGHPHLQRIDAIVPIRDDGYIVYMERLHACDEARATQFCRALGIGNDSGYDVPVVAPSASSAMGESSSIVSLRHIILELLAEGARTLPFWGGSDIRPGNLLCNEQQRIKVIDPIFVRGLAIVDAIQRGDRAQLHQVSLANLEAFLTIPVFLPGDETDKLREQLRAVY